MKIKNLLKTLYCVAAIGVAASPVMASCGAAACPIDTYQALISGEWRAGVRYESIDQNQIFVGDQLSSVGAIPGHHDEIQTLNQLTVIHIAHQLSDRWQVRLEMPYVYRQHSHLHHHHGEDILEEWEFNGWGDAILFTDFALIPSHTPDSATLVLTGGVQFPTGETGIRNSEGAAAEAPINPGSGAYGLITGIHYRRGVAVLPGLSGAMAVVPLSAGLNYFFHGAGTDGWRFGDEVLGMISTEYALFPGILATLQMNGKYQQKSDPGSTNEPVQNTGGTWIYISPGAEVQVSNTFIWDVQMQFPVYRNVNGIQQTAPWHFRTGITGVFK